MTKLCAVRAYTRRSSSRPDAYVNMHHWLRVEVAMQEWCSEFLSGAPDAAETGFNTRADQPVSASFMDELPEWQAARIRESF